MGDAAQGDAVVGKDVFVVLQMLADLGVLRRFQPGLQARQRLVDRQLRRRAGIIVGKQQVSLSRFMINLAED